VRGVRRFLIASTLALAASTMAAGCGDDTRAQTQQEWATTFCTATNNLDINPGNDARKVDIEPALATYHQTLRTLDPPPTTDPQALRAFADLLELSGRPLTTTTLRGGTVINYDRTHAYADRLSSVFVQIRRTYDALAPTIPALRPEVEPAGCSPDYEWPTPCHQLHWNQEYRGVDPD
jgi:hypothetical protein